MAPKSGKMSYGNAFIWSAISVLVYWRVHGIALCPVIFAIGTLVSTWLLVFAFKNTKHILPSIKLL